MSKKRKSGTPKVDVKAPGGEDEEKPAKKKRPTRAKKALPKKALAITNDTVTPALPSKAAARLDISGSSAVADDYSTTLAKRASNPRALRRPRDPNIPAP